MESYAAKHSRAAAVQEKRALEEGSVTLMQRSYTPKHSRVAAVQEKRALKEGSHPLIQRGYKGAS
jgi:hypothetical protein